MLELNKHEYKETLIRNIVALLYELLKKKNNFKKFVPVPRCDIIIGHKIRHDF